MWTHQIKPSLYNQGLGNMWGLSAVDYFSMALLFAEGKENERKWKKGFSKPQKSRSQSDI